MKQPDIVAVALDDDSVVTTEMTTEMVDDYNPTSDLLMVLREKRESNSLRDELFYFLPRVVYFFFLRFRTKENVKEDALRLSVEEARSNSSLLSMSCMKDPSTRF
jgi:hypothetical protein